MEESPSYKVVEVIGTSPVSWEDAAKNVIDETSQHIKDLRIAEVIGQDVKIEGGKIVGFRTKLSLSFRFHGASD